MARIKSRKTIVNGIEFDSITEADFYSFLLQNMFTMNIAKIEVHPFFELLPPFQVDCFICKGNGKVRGKREGTTKNCTRCTGTGKLNRQAMTYSPDFIITYKDGSKDVIDVKGQNGGYKNESFPQRKKVFEYVHKMTLIVVYKDTKKGVWIWK